MLNFLLLVDTWIEGCERERGRKGEREKKNDCESTNEMSSNEFHSSYKQRWKTPTFQASIKVYLEINIEREREKEGGRGGAKTHSYSRI